MAPGGWARSRVNALQVLFRALKAHEALPIPRDEWGARVQGPWGVAPDEGSSSVDRRMINHISQMLRNQSEVLPDVSPRGELTTTHREHTVFLASDHSGWTRTTSTEVLLELAPTDVCPRGTSQN
jgi:hypothetical protein